MLEENSNELRNLNKKITIVIPTLNEEEGLGKVMEELHSKNLWNILVVDGYSTDKTVEIATKLGAKVIYQEGKGKTGALKTAIEVVQTPYLLVMDGDYTYDANSIVRFLHHMDSHDEVIGARVSNGTNMSQLHRFGNQVISRVFNILMNTKLSDVCSGMYVLRTESAREMQLQTAGFDVEAEIAAQIASSGSITEVPINYRPRLGKQKLSTWRHGLNIVSSVFRLARSYNPGVYYSMLGSFLIIPAFAMLLNSVVEWTFMGRISNPWFFVGISMLLVAIQAMSVGAISLIMRRTELRIARRMKNFSPLSYTI